MRSISLVFIALLLTARVATADDVPFQKFNPDVDKYDFAKSFIAGLSYYSRVADRLGLEDKAAVESRSDIKAIQNFINHRTLDNSELRIAKNYLVRYYNSPNGLIRRVAIDSAATYQKLLEMSSRERGLWQSFKSFKTTGQPADFREAEFARQQLLLANEKKEVAKELIRQTGLMTKALLSAEKCSSEDCKELFLTQEERDKLAKKLDGFANGYMDWGLKPGQSTVQACIATLREVLEDSLYHSRPEVLKPSKEK